MEKIKVCSELVEYHQALKDQYYCYKNGIKEMSMERCLNICYGNSEQCKFNLEDKLK